MKLSEAIRLGSMMKPQAFHALSNDIGTCALGAALEAVGIGTQVCDAQAIVKIWSAWLPLFRGVQCPECGNVMPSPIAHLNDYHKWTRERIADWVESIETAQEAPRREQTENKVELNREVEV